MVGWFLFHWRNGLHVSLFIARSDDGYPSRWRGLGRWGCSAPASVIHPASCPATPAVVRVHPVHGLAGGTPVSDYTEDAPAAVQSVVPGSPAVSPAVK